MSVAGYPGYQSFFFKNLSYKHNKRLEKETYHQVLDHVSLLCSKISPRGCSQNTRISYDDIDRTQELIRTKERTSKLYADSQISKLNNPLKLTALNPLNCKRASCLNQNRLKLQKASKNKKISNEPSPVHNSLDEVIDRCDLFKPELKPHKKEIASHAFYRQNTSDIAYNYIEDLSECLKTTDDQEKIRNMMSTMKYNRNTDKSLKNELKYIKEELLETTNKIVKMAPYKLWRQNNIAFMSNADKVIASVPTVKK